MWLGVLLRLADGFPASRFAQEDSAGLRAMAGTWADELSTIPAIAIPEVHRRTMSKHVSTFAPSIGAYRAAWLDPAWDFWAELNADEEKNAPAVPMLPEGPRDMEAPGLVASMLQMTLLRNGRPVISCECCDPQTGIFKSATLSPSKTFWVCAQGECAFSLEIEHSNEAPLRPRRDVAHIKRQVGNSEETTKTMTQGRATLADIRRAAEECDIELEGMAPDDHAAFCAWVNWMRRTNPGTPINYTVLTLTWPKCQEEMQQRLQERLHI